MDNKKICRVCGVEKPIEECLKRENVCKQCAKNRAHEYYIKNKERLIKNNKIYREKNKKAISNNKAQYYKANKKRLHEYYGQWKQNNRDKIHKNNKKYYDKNRNKILNYEKVYRDTHKDKEHSRCKIYRDKNKDKIRNHRKLYMRTKLKKDIAFKLRHRVSAAIRQAINKRGGSKDFESIKGYLLYSMEDLKIHLEKQFDSWMNWENYGIYRAAGWDDNNVQTWTWQIDHIIPKADLPYKSMDEENFQKCWALSNLRPLNSKQNFIDGMTRVRHKKS